MPLLSSQRRGNVLSMTTTSVILLLFSVKAAFLHALNISKFSIAMEVIHLPSLVTGKENNSLSIFVG